MKVFANGKNYPLLSYSGSRRSLACAGANTLKNQSWRVFETRRKWHDGHGCGLVPWYHYGLRERSLQDRRIKQFGRCRSRETSGRAKSLCQKSHDICYVKNEAIVVICVASRRLATTGFLRYLPPRRLKTCGYQKRRRIDISCHRGEPRNSSQTILHGVGFRDHRPQLQEENIGRIMRANFLRGTSHRPRRSAPPPCRRRTDSADSSSRDTPCHR